MDTEDELLADLQDMERVIGKQSKALEEKDKLVDKQSKALEEKDKIIAQLKKYQHHKQ